LFEKEKEWIPAFAGMTRGQVPSIGIAIGIGIEIGFDTDTDFDGWHGYTAAVCGVTMFVGPMATPREACGVAMPPGPREEKEWIPAFAGMTKTPSCSSCSSCSSW